MLCFGVTSSRPAPSTLPFLCTSINYMNFKKTDGARVNVLGSPNGTSLAWGFVWSSFFCGFLTPAISSYFIKRSIRAGDISKILLKELECRSFSWFMLPAKTGWRTLRIFICTTVLLGGGAVLISLLSCIAVDSHNIKGCTISGPLFLAIEICFTFSVQFPVFWFNYTGCRNEKCFTEETVDAIDEAKSSLNPRKT